MNSAATRYLPRAHRARHAGPTRHWLRICTGRCSPGLPPNGSQFRKGQVDYGQVWQLYRERRNDHEIAREIGVDSSHICKWRKARGLTAHPADRALTPQKLRKARKMLRVGASKSQVVAELSIHKRTVQHIRRKMADSGHRRTGLSNRAISARQERSNNYPGSDRTAERQRP